MPRIPSQLDPNRLSTHYESPRKTSEKWPISSLFLQALLVPARIVNRTRRIPPFAIVLLVLAVFSFPTFLNPIVPPVSAASASFTFAASGDMGPLTTSTSVSNLNRLVTANPNFFLGLGDFSYDPSVTGNVWCGQFKAQFGNIQILP